MQVLNNRPSLTLGMIKFTPYNSILADALKTKCSRCGKTIDIITAKKVRVHGHTDGEAPTEANAWYKNHYYCNECEER